MNAGRTGRQRPYGGPVPVPADAALASRRPASLRPARALAAGWAAPAAGVAAWAGTVADASLAAMTDDPRIRKLAEIPAVEVTGPVR